jgi:hypothetical protein
MGLENRVRHKAEELQAQYQMLLNHWHQHSLSRFHYPWLPPLLIAAVTALLTRNKNLRRLYLTYNLIRNPPFTPRH